MTVSVLMENSALPGFQEEHGLSLHLAIGERQILLDAGSSGNFADNAEKLGFLWQKWISPCFPTDISTTATAFADFFKKIKVPPSICDGKP